MAGVKIDLGTAYLLNKGLDMGCVTKRPKVVKRVTQKGPVGDAHGILHI